MSDGIDLGDLPDVPEPSTKKVHDSFDYPVAYNFAFVGVGQGGGRIAATFNQLGYGRVCAINSTIADLRELKLSDDRKLDVGQARGAGKDPRAAEALIKDKGEDIYDLYKRSWGEEVDYAFVCLGAAGGTGAGCYTRAVEVAKSYLAQTNRPVKVGAIVALPKDAEGAQFAKNAFYTMKGLVTQGLSPVIFIDNQRVRALFDPAASQEHAKANTSTAQLLHLFNRMAGKESEHTTFDRADFAKLLDSGNVAFASANITSWTSPADVSTPIREKLKANVLATVDLTKGQLAGLIYVLAGAAYDEVPAATLDHGTEMLTRILQPGSTVFPGVYRGSGEQGSIKVLAMVGGLPWPLQRLDELARVAGEPKSVAEFLGV